MRIKEWMHSPWNQSHENGHLLHHTLDAIRVNCGTIYTLNNGIDPRKLNRFDFGFRLVESMVLPQIKRRSKSGLKFSVIKKIALFTGETINVVNDISFPHSNSLKHITRCKVCKDESRGTNIKASKDKLKKIKTSYQKYGEGHCHNHVVVVIISFNYA